MDGKSNDDKRIASLADPGTEWSTVQHFTHDRQRIGELVHNMVPNMICTQQGNDAHQVQNISGLPAVHETIPIETNSSGANLTALADAAELDQDRPDSLCTEGNISGLPLAPFLKPSDKEVTFYNEIYHYICSKTFSPKSSDSHRRIIKKRAANYMITEEGRLAYSTKNPKKVVTDLAEQNYLMKGSHIGEAGTHVGARKMQSNLSTNFHWRTMANDISNYIKDCDQCCTFFFPISDKSNPTEPSDGPASIDSPILSEHFVWKKVALHVHGPYKTAFKESKFVVSIADNCCKWISAKVVSGDDLENNCAHFLFDCFCSFGFTRCDIFDGSPLKSDRMNWFFEEKMQILSHSLSKSETNFIFVMKYETEDYGWITKLIDGFCNEEDENWDENLNAKLFTHNTTCAEKGASPFRMMHARDHFNLGDCNEEEKENAIRKVKSSENTSVRRRLRSSTLQCRHCYETFTSKISFRIHQRRHTEDARRRGILDGEERMSVLSDDKIGPKAKKRRRLVGTSRILTIANTDWPIVDNKAMPTVVRSHLTQSTVDAVRNLLHATKEERNKRGKYFKYTPELRDQIAQYAMDHSIPAASLHWSDRLGSTVSESSIRNFMKAYKCYSAAIKDEIGRCAFHNGIERTALDYSEKLGFEIRKGVVLKFKKLYTRRVCEGGSVGSAAVSVGVKRNCSASGRQKRTFSFLTKEEIGRYAQLHGISAAMDFFSVKLQFSVKESTVRKFKRRYQERINCSAAGEQLQPHHATQVHASQDQGPSPSVEVLHNVMPSVTCSNPGPANTPNNYVYEHSYPINMTPGAGASMSHNGSATILPMNHNVAFHQSGVGVLNQGVAALSYHQSPGTPGVIMNQPFASMAPATFPQNFNNFSQLAPSVTGGQCLPITIAHTGHAPIQLTMGGQLTPVSHSHLLNHSSTMHHQPHPGQQILTSSFPNHIANGFDPAAQLAGHSAVNFSSEPVSLLKEENGGMPVVNHVCTLTNPTHLQEAAINGSDSVNGMPAPMVQLAGGNNLPQIVPSAGAADLNMATGRTDVEEYLDDEFTSLSEAEYSDSSCGSRTKKKRRPEKMSAVKFTFGCGKRGNYVSYTPELRAEIGRFGAERGNLEAIAHFKAKLGLEIPESTVRGLKDKYLIKRIHGNKNVKSLGFGQRGRPMRLGKYDALVQDCIRQLVKEGEKISSFLVIATAKQVLTQNEPSLLEENGGPVTLNSTWAKSFLKRIGIHHNA